MSYDAGPGLESDFKCDNLAPMENAGVRFLCGHASPTLYAAGPESGTKAQEHLHKQQVRIQRESTEATLTCNLIFKPSLSRYLIGVRVGMVQILRAYNSHVLCNY